MSVIILTVTINKVSKNGINNEIASNIISPFINFLIVTLYVGASIFDVCNIAHRTFLYLF